MSKDVYKLNIYKHGGAHIDRYRRSKNILRYRLDGTPIPHNGVIPPPIPVADVGRFLAEAAKADR
jgi:hypothetical protein